MKAIPVETLPQVLPPDAEPWRRLLWDAADLMERVGKSTAADRDGVGPEGQLCVIRSMGRVKYGDGKFSEHDGFVAECRLEDFLRIAKWTIPGWSDGNDQHTVVTAMRACALQGA